VLRQFGQRLRALTAAKATFALKARLWFRRARFVISPHLLFGSHAGRFQEETSLSSLSKFCRAASPFQFPAALHR
jgi:hypothetical protein